MLKNATLRQLSAFHAVARLGSVSRAASELYLTQPAVSIQLKLLEEAAGTPLLLREGRGVRLTPAGDLMASYAGRILDLWRDVGDGWSLGGKMTTPYQDKTIGGSGAPGLKQYESRSPTTVFGPVLEKKF